MSFPVHINVCAGGMCYTILLNCDLNFPPIFIKLAGIVALDCPNNTNIDILSLTHDTREQMILCLRARH